MDATDLLMAEIDGLLGDNRSQARRDSGGSDDTEFYDAASDLDYTTDPPMPVRTSTPDYGLSEGLSRTNMHALFFLSFIQASFTIAF